MINVNSQKAAHFPSEIIQPQVKFDNPDTLRLESLNYALWQMIYSDYV